MLNRSKLYALGLLLAAFAAGIAVGGAASAALGDRAENERSRDGRRGQRSYTDRLAEDLDLSMEQRDSVEQILRNSQAAMNEIWGDVRVKTDTIRNDVRQQIMMVLDADQQDAYRARNARSDSARAAQSRGERGRSGGRHEN
jgi:hypothetical protein